MIRRTNYFIKKRFQLHFLYRFLVLLLAEALLIAGLFMYISSNTLTTGYFDSILTVERTPSFFFVPFLLIILIAAIGMGITGMVVFILLSHRIAGPLYRFEQDLEEISGGDLTKRINLRKTDQLTELQESLNMMLESFDQRIARIKARAAELKELASKKGDPETIAKIHETIESLSREIDRFKATSGPKE